MSKGKNRPEVAALLSERARFETWLDQLADKAATMPAHVVARVRGDYELRLEKVMDALRERADALREDASTLEARVASLDAELTAKREARVEDELRALVGEYDADAWTAKAAEHDTAINAVEFERAERQAECAKALEMLAEATRPSRPMSDATDSAAAASTVPPPPVADTKESAAGAGVQTEPAVSAAPPTPTQQPRRPSPFDEIGFLRTVVGRSTPFPGLGAPDESTDEVDVPDTLVPPTRATPSTPAASVRSTPSTPAASVRSTPSSSVPAVPRESGRASVPNFDPPPIPDTLPPPSRTSGITPAFGVDTSAASKDTNGERRVSSAAEPSRSLKCQECGSMNYPTEWYCEKCGGELAAF